MPPPAVNPARPKIQISLIGCIAVGFGTGIVGVAAMTVGEKVEQAIPKRPNSLVPGKTLAAFVGMPESYCNAHPDVVNHALHWG